jgi:molybdopterin molybdotransferase
VSAGERLRTVEEAREAILAVIGGPLGEETVDVGAALGRVLARPVVAAVTLPPWDNSAMDGYAIVAGDVAGASDVAPREVSVAGDVPAGGSPMGIAVRAGQAVRIATGAPVPPGADAVVPVELTTPIHEGRAGERGRDAAGPNTYSIQVHSADPKTVG